MLKPVEIAQGHWGRVYDLGDGSVIKCFRPEADPNAIRVEAEIGNLAANLGVSTPKVLGVQNTPKQGIIRFEKITGHTLARYVLERPWKLIWATHQMAKIFVQIHKIKVTGTRPIKRALANRIKRAPELSYTDKESILGTLNQLEDGDRLCHYDYHPGNIMVSEAGCYVIDWGGATHGVPLADVTHAYVLNKVDGVLEDVPWFNRLLIRSARNLYIEMFLYFYAQHSKEFSYRDIKRGIRRWIIPIAAARLASYGDFETEALLKIIKKWG